MILVIAKSDLNDVLSLQVTIATEMRYPGVGTKKNSVNISGAMDFYAVFRTVIVINNGKMEKWLKIKQNNVLQIFWISNILCIFLLHSMDFQIFLWKHYLLSGRELFLSIKHILCPFK